MQARRPQLAPEVLEGAWVHGREAIALGLCDELSPSLEAALAALLA